MTGLVQALLRLWRWICGWFSRKPQPLRTVLLDERPEKIESGVVYVLGEGLHRWFVIMLCPCGCGDTVEMSLLENAKPRWWLTEHPDQTVSLKPSVWRRVGCRSHFFLQHGLIEWC